VEVGEDWALSFTIDLVLYDSETSKPICVLDTKYKAKDRPETNDVTQVVAYAEMKRCNKSILIYPVSLSRPLDEKVGNIGVQSMMFSLNGDIEEAGRLFIQLLMSQL